MSTRRSLGLPITLGVVMIVLLVVLIVGWVVMSASAAWADSASAPLYWALLSVGATCLALVLAGVVIYLSLSVKAINLNRRQSNFIDSVTHELKSPIASLKLYLQTLHRREMSREECLSFYQQMLEDVERLDDLINHLLDAARLEKSDEQLAREIVQLDELLQQCAQAARQRYHESEESLQLDLAPCCVEARRVDLEVVFRNLLDNAYKYGGASPEVTVTLQLSPHGTALARIADNGRGIPPHLRRKIFSRFVRLGLELERKAKGTGLGLYIVRTVVSKLKGRVSVKDRPGGSGTIFEIELPAKPLASPTDAPPIEDAKQPA